MRCCVSASSGVKLHDHRCRRPQRLPKQIRSPSPSGGRRSHAKSSRARWPSSSPGDSQGIDHAVFPHASRLRRLLSAAVKFHTIRWRAKQLLVEAAIPHGFDTELVTYNTSAKINVLDAELSQGDLASTCSQIQRLQIACDPKFGKRRIGAFRFYFGSFGATPSRQPHSCLIFLVRRLERRCPPTVHRGVRACCKKREQWSISEIRRPCL